MILCDTVKSKQPALRMLWIPEELHSALLLIKHETGIPLNRLVADAIKEKYGRNKKPLRRGVNTNEI
jgi:hypothetical protein